jgi:hypothetical protein
MLIFGILSGCMPLMRTITLIWIDLSTMYSAFRFCSLRKWLRFRVWRAIGRRWITLIYVGWLHTDQSAQTLAYIMGHQSTDSISVYGDRRSGTGREVYVRAADNADLAKIRHLSKVLVTAVSASSVKLHFPKARRLTG